MTRYRIGMIRTRAGLSRLALAQATGRSAKMIERYENGKVEPPADVLIKMAAALSVSVDELLNLQPRLPSEMEVNGQRYVLHAQTRRAASATSSDRAASPDDELTDLLVARDEEVGRPGPRPRRSGRTSNG